MDIFDDEKQMQYNQQMHSSNSNSNSYNSDNLDEMDEGMDKYLDDIQVQYIDPKKHHKNANTHSLQHVRFQSILEKWRIVCQTKKGKEILKFFNEHASILSFRGSWFLKHCLLNNDINSLQLLLSHARCLYCINKPFGFGSHSLYTPLLYASRYCNFGVIKLLTCKGADVSLSCNSCILEHIFENASLCKHDNIMIECVEYLVNLGCVVIKNAIWCLSYYNSNIEYDRVYLANFLKQNGASLIHVTTAIKYGHIELAEWLISNKCAIYNSYLTDVCTAEGINLLLKNGIENIDYNDHDYGTALYYHCRRNNIEAVHALLSNGAATEIKCTSENMTALEIANKSKHSDIVTLLLDYNKNKNAHRSNNNNDINDFRRILMNRGGGGGGSSLNMSSDQLTVMRLKGKTNVKFDFESKFPLKPAELLENDVLKEEKNCDEMNATCLLIENKIENYQMKLKKEYCALLKLRKECSSSFCKIDEWKSSLDEWSKFELNWNKWDIDCFIEWLKRIHFKRGSFETYFKTADDAKLKISEFIMSDPATFGANDDVDGGSVGNGSSKFLYSYDCIRFGTLLQSFDRYTLHQIGINDTSDCNMVALKIQKLLTLKNQYDDSLCVICYDRDKTHALNCGHRFCEPDIMIIQKQSNLCPLCNTDITIVIKLF